MNPQNQQLVSQTYAAAVAAGFDPNVFQGPGFSQPQFAYSSAPAFPQFASAVPTSHPQQQHLHQLNMQHAAVFQSVMAQQQQQQQQAEPSTSSGKKTQSKAERRAEHNAIERARRESLNSKFQQLAHALPNLQNDRRPSKGTIIERTLEYVRNTLHKEERYRHQIRHLLRENRRMHRDLHRKKRDAGESQSIASSISSEDELQYSYPASIDSSTPTPTMPSRQLGPDYDMMVGPAQQSMPWEVYTIDACSPMGTSSQQSLYEDRSDDDSDDFDHLGYISTTTPEPYHQQYPPMPMMMGGAEYVAVPKVAQQQQQQQIQQQHHCMQMMPEYHVKMDSMPRSRQ